MLKNIQVFTKYFLIHNKQRFIIIKIIQDTIPDLPYHVSRDRYHQFPVEVIEDDFNKDDTPIDINKIAQLEEKKLLTAVTNIRGDLWVGLITLISLTVRILAAC